MSAAFTKVRNGLLTLAVAGVLGFGASQALASPAAPAPPPTCDPVKCNRLCEAMGGPFASGFCDPERGCVCAL